jgi:hypothetical protein
MVMVTWSPSKTKQSSTLAKSFGQKDDDKTGDEDNKDVTHSADDPTVQEVYDSMSEDQKNVVAYMVGAALEDAAAQHDGMTRPSIPVMGPKTTTMIRKER